ncbi:hypothetical protein Q5O_04025 [Pseudomonas putida JB]|jgi:hypothetical protein|uniref:Uncharacterized protein n=1 Tax=Pseudomonas putida S12 TaxID=1215087 RepID=A0AA34WQE2_PSEPU|nr:hypothetical protein RPPX_05320 [Pseudomonas putida S12]AOX07572.1 hypothetical protein Q5O_04025 [Pseudomonas putida JB]RIZ36685.1 hypothetical protein CIK02_23390 [Pseudomonas putida]
MFARLAVNAAHLKMMGAIGMEKTATKSNMADGQGLGRGFGEVFRRFIALSGLFAGEPAPTELRGTCRSGFTREEAASGNRNAPASRGVLGITRRSVISA